MRLVWWSRGGGGWHGRGLSDAVLPSQGVFSPDFGGFSSERGISGIDVVSWGFQRFFFQSSGVFEYTLQISSKMLSQLNDFFSFKEVYRSLLNLLNL